MELLLIISTSCSRPIDAWATINIEKRALRGMDFVVLSQLGPPQAGWAQQYDMDLQPAGARSYEPAGLAPSTTVSNIRHLLAFYKITGNRKYLRGIPDAIEWLRNSPLPPGHSDEGHTHAQFVEVDTGKPLYAHREGTSREKGRYWVDHEPKDFPGHYGMQLRIDIDALEAEYARVSALTPEEAMAEYRPFIDTKETVPVVSPETVRSLIDSLDERGAWWSKTSPFPIIPIGNSNLAETSAGSAREPI